MNESSITLALRKVIEKHMLMRKISDRFNAGLPDLLGCWNGRFVAIEMKVHPGKPTDLQKFTMSELVANGAAVFLITYFKDTRSFEVRPWTSDITQRLENKEKTVTWLLNHLCSSIKPTR